MNPRSLLLRKGVIDTSLVDDVTPSDKNPSTWVLNLRVLPGKAVRTCAPESHEATDWPQSSDVLCWYCCHRFSGPPLPMPFKYDDRRDIFHVSGVFCSWACMKSFNGESNSYLKGLNAINIAYFRKRCTGQLGYIDSNGKLQKHIVPSPPRMLLKAFGGTMSIEEFRAASGADRIYRLLPPKLVIHNPLVEERRPTPLNAASLLDNVSFGGVRTQNDALRLKRPKPLASHNLLERTMGIQRG